MVYLRPFLFCLAGIYIIAGLQDIRAEKPVFEKIFGVQYTVAVEYFNDQTWITDSLVSHGIRPVFAKAIVFPELIRYSALKDKLEMQGLYALYVQYGSGRYSDFSVGRFQMKPSFALQVEKDIKAVCPDQFFALSGIDTSDTPKCRLERVQRLESPEWQVQYLIAFIYLMDRRFGNDFKNDIRGKLMFYASAYNCGYQKSEGYIRQMMTRNFFHTALVSSDICYNYGNIAVDYYESVVENESSGK